MKGLLVILGLVVAALLYAMSNFGVVTAPILNRIVLQEGALADVQAAGQADVQAGGQGGPTDAFVVKYQPFLDQRYWLGRVAIIVDDDTFIKVASDTHDRYTTTPLQNNPEYGYLTVHWAEMLADRNQFDQAGHLYEEYMQLFPQGDDINVARSALSNLRINHGFQ